MKLEEYIQDKHLSLSSTEYLSNDPFPHIVIDNFINETLLDNVESEFPDLASLQDVVSFSSETSLKFASKGFKDLSPSAGRLISFLNSDVFLNYLRDLTGINEPLFSDPYLEGGGYHQIKSGGFLKTHIDFTKHKQSSLDRRINLLIYLNKGWVDDWGGSLCLFDKEDLKQPSKKISPMFNRCVIFSTSSFSYHGHPDPVICPIDTSRRSIALYYFSNGRPSSEVSAQSNNDPHQTFWVDESGRKIGQISTARRVISKLLPPVVKNIIRKVLR